VREADPAWRVGRALVVQRVIGYATQIKMRFPSIWKSSSKL
jgi:hypothetical protein